jgi:hypothetical protein
MGRSGQSARGRNRAAAAVVHPASEFIEGRIMKRFTPVAIGAVLAASVAFAAHAQAPAPGTPSYAPRAAPQDAPRDPVAFAQQNLASLRSRLAIAPSQASAWNAFVDAVLNQSRDMQSQMAQMPQGSVSAPERMDVMARMMRRSADGMANVAQALRQLYSQLDPNQRSIVDQEFARGPGAGGPPPQG